MKFLLTAACALLLTSCGELTGDDTPEAVNERMFNGFPVLPYYVTDYHFENGQSDKVLAKFITTLPANGEKITGNTLEFLRDSIMRNEPAVRMMALYIYKDKAAAEADENHTQWQSMLIQVSDKDYKVYHQ